MQYNTEKGAFFAIVTVVDPLSMRVQLEPPLDDPDLELCKRVLGYLATCGERGATRSDLIQRYRLSAKILDRLLVHLRQREGFFEITESTKGRPSQRFTFQPAVSVRDEDGVRRCIWCSEPVAPTRASSFCSDGCQQLAAAEQVKIKDILGAPATGGVLVAATRFLVAAHLTARGYFPHFGDNPTTLAVGTKYGYYFALHVVIGDAAGDISAAYLAQFHGAALAVVLRTGRVSYYGLPDAEAPTRIFDASVEAVPESTPSFVPVPDLDDEDDDPFGD